MQILLNGERREFDHGLSVAAMLETIGCADAKIAVERNLEIVPRSAFAATVLQPEDRIEIVEFIGGG